MICVSRDRWHEQMPCPSHDRSTLLGFPPWIPDEDAAHCESWAASYQNMLLNPKQQSPAILHSNLHVVFDTAHDFGAESKKKQMTMER